MSQIDAAEKAGVARATLQNAEAGRFTPRADALARIAGVYGVTIDSLFVHEPEAGTPADGRGKGHEPDTAAVGGSAGLAHEGA